MSQSAYLQVIKQCWQGGCDRAVPSAAHSGPSCCLWDAVCTLTSLYTSVTDVVVIIRRM